MISMALHHRLRRSLTLAVVMGMACGSLRADSAADQAKVVAADTTFGFRLLRELVQQGRGKNVFISPYSISTVLQMVGNGAAGQTREELAQGLGTGGLSTSGLNQAVQALDGSIRSAGTNVTLTIANSIWYSVDINVRPQFIAVNREFFGAAIESADFTDPRTAGVVNRWADQQTQGRIRQVFQGRLPSDTRMILANAIYFKGNWERKFDARLTEPQTFHLTERREQAVPMMQQGGTFDYCESKTFQAVRLPYQGGRLAMYVLLPEGHTGMKLLTTLNAQTWQEQVLATLKKREGSVSLPRFKLEYGAELKKALQAMGIRQAFQNNADFSGMAAAPLCVGSVIHKSFVEVNEAGTEAAAVTAAQMRLTSVRPVAPPFRMVVDRPFLFVIADLSTKAILFSGIITNPAT